MKVVGGVPGVASVVCFPMASFKNNLDVLPGQAHSSGQAGFFRNLATFFLGFSDPLSPTQAAPEG